MALKVDPHGNSKNAVMSGALNARIFDIARGMPGRRRWMDGRLVFEATRANIDYLRRHLEHETVYWNIDQVGKYEQLEKLEADARELKERVLPPEASKFNYKTKPFAEQEKAFLISRDRECYGLFLEQGLGKTKIILDTAAYLWQQGKINALFVLAPNGVHRQWIREQVPLHLPDWVEHVDCVYRSQQTKKWKREWQDMMDAPPEKLRIFTMNHEAIQSQKGQQFALSLCAHTNTLTVIDESHVIKNQSAKRTKFVLKSIRPLSKYRRIMTGTPISKGVEDYFTQLKFLSDDVHGFSSFYTYRNRYCLTREIPGAPKGAVKIVGYQNVDELKERVDAYAIRIRADECLDLPERMYSRREVPLTAEQVKYYKEMAGELVTQVDGELITAEQAIVKVIRLQQILCGHIKTEQGKTLEIPFNRPQVVHDYLTELQQKCVVWTRFRYDVEQLYKVLKPFNPVYYDGSMNDDQKANAKRTFIEHEPCRVFIGNQTAAGTGLDGLQAVSNHMVYYSNGFKAIDRWQSEARLYRRGQKGTVSVVDLVAPNTFDEDVLDNLRKKKDVAFQMLDLKEKLNKQIDLLEKD